MILLLGRDLSNLSMYGIVIGRSIYIADDTQGYGETVTIAHESEFQLQGIVLAMCIVYQHVVKRIAILANLDNLQAKALLHETELVVLAKDEFLAMTYVDGVLLAAFLVIDGFMRTIVEDDAVLQNFADGSTLMLVGSL